MSKEKAIEAIIKCPYSFEGTLNYKDTKMCGHPDGGLFCDKKCPLPEVAEYYKDLK